ncbi:MAG: hypothetical protein H8K03_20155 [Nitrospira sp.]
MKDDQTSRVEGNGQSTSSAPPSLSLISHATLQPPEGETTSGDSGRAPEPIPSPPELARAPHILERFIETIRTCGVVGEDRAAQLIFLVMISRFLERMVSAVLKGPSSGGKSFILATVLRFFSKRAYHELTGMSERVLAYSTEPLSHRFLVLYEAAGIGPFGTYLIRSLLSEGCIRYETLEQTKEGWRPKVLHRPGPSGFLSSTTAIKLHPENETRFLSVPISDTREQTQKVLERQADGLTDQPDLSEWLDLQNWLEKVEHRVNIPFAKQLAHALPPVALRLRRDFPMLLSLIKAHAILHQLNRKKNANGHILATLEDYTVVQTLISDLLAEGVGLSVPLTVRETVEAVRTIQAKKKSSKWATVLEVATILHLDISSASRRVKKALLLGYLANAEHGRGKPYRLVIGEPLPEEKLLLPTPEELNGCTIAEKTEEGRGHE